ncbi:MAG: ribonuclease PH [bacterium]
MAFRRVDGRKPDEIRRILISPGYLKYPEGSVLIEAGNTRVLCSVSVENRVPFFLQDKSQGWITAEYSMLPRSTHTRTQRESSRGHLSGRTQEIQRLIGRSLRAAVDLKGLGERQFIVDCDVIQADGGTRTLAITGACVAMHLAVRELLRQKVLEKAPKMDLVAAVSVGIVNGEMLLDLCYEEDSNAEVDFNIVMTRRGRFVEVQGTGERSVFSRSEMDRMIRLATMGIRQLIDIQRKVLRI